MRDAFQDRMPGNVCFGCGAGNARGLRIKSRWEGDDAVCIFRPEPHQNAGVPEVVNGGIIATVVDCHCICTAVADAYRRAGRAIGSDPLIWYVTGSLTVVYRKPAPAGRPLEFRARVTGVDGRRTFLRCTVSANAAECVVAKVTAVRVPADWRAGAAHELPEDPS